MTLTPGQPSDSVGKQLPFISYLVMAFSLVMFDQISKLAVYENMIYGPAGEIRLLGNWLKLHYTLNPGMAFGLTISAKYGKLILSIFRLIAVMGIGYYLWKLYKAKLPHIVLLCWAFIWAGATGNVIDGTFYGVWLDNAPPDAITPWFHGQVIDMIYLDIWEGILPDWLPIIGGQYYAFWPIFNLADASIFCGIALLLFMQITQGDKLLPENNKLSVAEGKEA